MGCKHQGNIFDRVKVLCTSFIGSTQYTPVAQCPIHKRCLPTFKPNKELYDRWKQQFQIESQIYKVCKYCDEHCPESHSDTSEI